MSTPKLLVYKLPGNEDIPYPAYATEGAAGFDLYSAVKQPRWLHPQQWTLVPTGICVELPLLHSMDVQPRSGLANKWGLTVLNSPGLVDSDFRGEVMVMLYHHGVEPFRIERGERIAQAVIRPFVRVAIQPVEKSTDLSATGRGTGGFGSTGSQALPSTTLAVPKEL